MTLIGDGKEFADFVRHAEGLGLSDTVVFRGRIPNTEALAQLSSAHVGVIPHFADESWHTTIPNKLFDYMAAGLAVVTSDARPAARIIRDTGGGAVFRNRDPGDLATALTGLADTTRLRDCAERGRQAIRDRYNWERDTADLLGAIEAAVERRAPSSGAIR